jgi:hypothetical protein
MAILNFPDIKPTAEVWELVSPTQTFSSPLDGRTQTRKLLADRWRCSLTFANLNKAEVLKLRAFLWALRGRSGRFYYSPHDTSDALSNPSGSPVVDGATSSKSIASRGWPTNEICRAAGEFVSIGDQLFGVEQDVTSDGLGDASIELAPDPRITLADGQAIEFAAPRGVFQLSDDSAAIQLAQTHVYAVNFNFVEASDI